MNSIENGKPNDHLANERTFLAWMRTSIGIMGFGFIVVKFSMFIKHITLLIEGRITISEMNDSGIIGVLLVIIGVLTAILALINYKRIKRQLQTGNYSSSNPLTTFLTVGMVLISIFLIWLLYRSI
ncbi:YidH family protein [Galbibacter sp.]|jgi:putative membrane protein|uniref:YidH family protein n=1 Tax=Galbibacter sp. TaxID=2918471 RepID=UPI003A8DA812